MCFFAFLGIDYPPVAWAVMRGVIVSADHVPHDGPGFLSFMQAGMLVNGAGTRLFNEKIIEQHRPNQQVSRLRGIYLFESREIAERLVGDPEWPPYFTDDNLVELDLQIIGATTRVDADWITHASVDANGRLDLNQLDWIGRYWAGEARSDKPIWETIANGVVVVLDQGARERAYETVHREFPLCWISAEMARLAGEAGEDAGLVAPFLLKVDETTYSLDYWFNNAGFHDPALIERMHEHPDFGRLLARVGEAENIVLPDFRPFGTTLNVGPIAAEQV